MELEEASAVSRMTSSAEISFTLPCNTSPGRFSWASENRTEQARIAATSENRTVASA
jgi:hypothetical protein